MTHRPSKTASRRRPLADTLSALLVATALVAPAPAVIAADAPATTKDSGKKADNPCAPSNPCAPAKKKKRSNGDNPCAPANPCAPRK